VTCRRVPVGGWRRTRSGTPPEQPPSNTGNAGLPHESPASSPAVSGRGAVAATAGHRAQGPQPNWYPDPFGGGIRYWDGAIWTRHVAVATTPVTSQTQSDASGELSDLGKDGGLGPGARSRSRLRRRLVVACVIALAIGGVVYGLSIRSSETSSKRSARSLLSGEQTRELLEHPQEVVSSASTCGEK